MALTDLAASRRRSTIPDRNIVIPSQGSEFGGGKLFGVLTLHREVLNVFVCGVVLHLKHTVSGEAVNDGWRSREGREVGARAALAKLI